MKNKRVQITMTKEQMGLLNRLCEVTSKPKTQVVNEALKLYSETLIERLKAK